MPRVLVTGANGFVGAAVCRHLQERGWSVRGSLRRGGAHLPQGVVPVITGDINADTDWSSTLAEIDAVVHCAARVHVVQESEEDPLPAFRRVNVDASRQLAEQAAAAGVRRFVFLSSIGAARADADPATAKPYQLSKLEAETALRRIAAGSQMVLVLLRPPLVYGPGAPGNFARLTRLVATGWPLPLASINNLRSLLFIGNLVSAIEAGLACSRAPEKPLALADGEDISTPELARRIGKFSGHPARLFSFPVSLLRLASHLTGQSAALESLTSSLTIDNTPICTTLGWSPGYTVDQGLTITFRGQGQSQPT